MGVLRLIIRARALLPRANDDSNYYRDDDGNDECYYQGQSLPSTSPRKLWVAPQSIELLARNLIPRCLRPHAVGVAGAIVMRSVFHALSWRISKTEECSPLPMGVFRPCDGVVAILEDYRQALAGGRRDAFRGGELQAALGRVASKQATHGGQARFWCRTGRLERLRWASSTDGRLGGCGAKLQLGTEPLWCATDSGRKQALTAA